MKEKSKTDNELLQEISGKLDDLIGILSISGKDRDDQVKHLVGLGYSNSAIARVTGIPKGTVDGIRASFPTKDKKSKE